MVTYQFTSAYHVSDMHKTYIHVQYHMIYYSGKKFIIVYTHKKRLHINTSLLTLPCNLFSKRAAGMLCMLFITAKGNRI